MEKRLGCILGKEVREGQEATHCGPAILTTLASNRFAASGMLKVASYE